MKWAWPCLAAIAFSLAGCSGGDHARPAAAEVRATPNGTPADPTPENAEGADDASPPSAGRVTRSAGCGTGAASSAIVTLSSGGEDRTARVHVPPGYDGSHPYPLVLNYHGYDRDGLQQETYSGLADFADREGFILVSPDGAGSPRQWEVVGVYGDSGMDDVSFTSDLVASLEANYCIDLDRIYATGLSNGAEMASQAGCLLPDVFAAVAPVAGVVYQDCAGGPMPVVSFHGTDDYNVPFETARPAMADWAKHNGCSDQFDTGAVAPTVTRERYTGCGGADVVLYVIDGGGHTWPGAEDDAGGVGPTTHEISANALIWEFFQQHPRTR